MHRKSVCLCELWQEGGAYGKTATPWLFSGCPFPLSDCGHESSVCVPRPLAAAERQERSD
ncbi:hypothetical protein FKK41_26990 [Klebsiella pneumoniae]|nr:hypothetical protein [Klebsiella pneumoniae]